MHDKDTENFKSFERNKVLFLNREAFFPHLLQEALAVLGNLISARDAATLSVPAYLSVCNNEIKFK